MQTSTVTHHHLHGSIRREDHTHMSKLRVCSLQPTLRNLNKNSNNNNNNNTLRRCGDKKGESPAGHRSEPRCAASCIHKAT